MRGLTEITEPVIAIVHFKSDELAVEARGGRVIYYQVTIDPKNTSDGGFIRFGNIHGDEITGWVLESNLVIDEILLEGAKPAYMGELRPHQDMIAA